MVGPASSSRKYDYKKPSSFNFVTLLLVLAVAAGGYWAFKFGPVYWNRFKAEEILRTIDEDEDIAILILAAATSKEGPGPMVSGFAKGAGTFPIPVAIVPGHLSDEDLDSMT